MSMSLVPKMDSYIDNATGIKIENISGTTTPYKAFDKNIDGRGVDQVLVISKTASVGRIRITFPNKAMVTEFDIFINSMGFTEIPSTTISNEDGKSHTFNVLMDWRKGAQKYNFKLEKPLIGTTFIMNFINGVSNKNYDSYIQEIDLFGVRVGNVLLEINNKLCTIVNGNVTVINSDISTMDEFVNQSIPISSVIANMDAIKNIGEKFKILSISI